MKLIQTPKQREAKINRKQGLRVYKEALQWTKKIMRGTRGLISLTRIPDHKDSRSIEEYKFLNRYIRWALELNAPLQRMIQTFEDHSKQKNHIGRKEADYTGFISRIAKIYQEYIGKPTKHKYGPFSYGVQMAMESLGLPSKDPARAISKGIDNLTYKKG